MNSLATKAFPVIYLTGAPAAGKSSTAALLQKRIKRLEVFEFGARLTSYINSLEGSSHKQTDLRSLSGQISTTDHVSTVDAMLKTFVAENRNSHPIVIDSHPVTKESYGYRITPYSLEDFSSLSPTHIWMLYAPSKVTVERIRSNSQGRPEISEEEAMMHTHLQAAVAATYGMSLGVPIEIFNSAGSLDDLADLLAAKMVRTGCEYV